MNKLPFVQIIVLNWNGRSFLEACLSALSNLDYPAYSILLIDNDSTDDSIGFVRRRFPHVTILRNEKNLGYAGGNNRALINLSADYAVLVNPDIVVAPDWLTQLISPMHAARSIGIAGCKLHYPDGQIIQHAGGAITHPQALPVHQGMYELDTGQYDALRDVDYVTGAAIAISRTAMERIGLLDEGYFMYFEEADYCARARAAGYRVVYIPRATAVHDESAIAVKGSFSYLQRFHKGRWRYLLKHFPLAEILSTTVAAEELWLAERKSGERRALKLVYRAVRAGLDEILNTRVSDGGTEVNAEQQIQLAASLIRLRKAAIEQSIDQEQLNRLAQKAQVREGPFRSQTPIIGPIIVQLRSLWASVAAREQARSFTMQQNEINRMLINELREIENRFQAVEVGFLDHDEKQVGIKQHQSVVRAELSHAYELLDSIKARLERIEEHAL
jgi:GT2 family glycosyltransferase